MSNKISSQKYWDEDPRAAHIKQEYKDKQPKICCKVCGASIVYNRRKKRKTCSSECYKILRRSTNPHIPGFKNYKKSKQQLLIDGNLPDIICSTHPTHGTPGRGKTLELELARRRKITEKTKISNNGGHRYGSGRGKKGWYKGIFCDSSWEFAFVLYCEKYNIPIERNNEKFPYVYLDKQSSYLPDFIVDGQYVEIKGYLSDRNKAKIDQFPHPISVYAGKEMKPIIEEIINLYGKDYIRLYEPK